MGASADELEETRRQSDLLRELLDKHHPDLHEHFSIAEDAKGANAECSEPLPGAASPAEQE